MSKLRARVQLRNAVKLGIIIKPATCSKCGVTCEVEGHHSDYDKPLEVEWLCKYCHIQSYHTRYPKLSEKEMYEGFKQIWNPSSDLFET
jgi:hypothetical protein